MMHDFAFGLWFFMPAGMANVAPILVAKAPGLKHWQTPVDFGVSWRGIRLFGDHKTWRGIVTGSIVAILVMWLQVTLFHHSAWIRSISQPVDYNHVSIIGLGFLLGFGALAGDLVKSFVKRRFGVRSGHSWFPFDQLDYIVGGVLLSAIYMRLPAILYIWIVITYFGLHLFFSYVGYLLKLKDRPI